jgi:hypothetical protein
MAMLEDTLLWRDLASFRKDWNRWSVGEKLAVAASALMTALAATLMLAARL